MPTHNFDETQGNWDLRDARGRSARVYAPGAGKRDRREKRWYERTSFLKKAAIIGALGTVAGGTAYALKKPKVAGAKSKTIGQRFRDAVGQDAVYAASAKIPDTIHFKNTQHMDTLTHLENLTKRFEFAYTRQPEEAPKTSLLGRIGSVAAGAAGAGLAYGAGSFLRGRFAKPGASWKDQVRAGHSANVAGVQKLLGRAPKPGIPARATQPMGNRFNITKPLAGAGGVRGFAERLENVIEFLTKDQAELARLKGQNPEGNTLRGAGIGLLSGGIPQAVAGYQTGGEFEKAKVVYRKRDAAAAGLAGLAGGLAGGLGGNLAGGFAGGRFGKSEKAMIGGAAIGNAIGAIGGGYLASRAVGKAQLRGAIEDKKRPKELASKNVKSCAARLEDLIEFASMPTPRAVYADEVGDAEYKLVRNSRVQSGSAIGAALGTAAGVAGGLAINKGLRARGVGLRHKALAPTTIGYLGLAGGLAAGNAIGSRIRDKNPPRRDLATQAAFRAAV